MTAEAKAAEAAASAYYNPVNPHNVYMPTVSSSIIFLSAWVFAVCKTSPRFHQGNWSMLKSSFWKGFLLMRESQSCTSSKGSKVPCCVSSSFSQWHNKVCLNRLLCFVSLSYELMFFYFCLYFRTSHPLLPTSHQRIRKTNKLPQNFSTTHRFLTSHFGWILGHGP